MKVSGGHFASLSPQKQGAGVTQYFFLGRKKVTSLKRT
jgi:hypothetical protein